MPNKPNARKALRQNKKRALANRLRAEAFKDAIKKVRLADSIEKAKTLARAAQQALDKAVRAGIIKKNTAARRLSRLMAKVNAGAKKS